MIIEQSIIHEMSDPIKPVDRLPNASNLSDDTPSVVDSDVSSIPSCPPTPPPSADVDVVPQFIRTVPPRIPLQWEFKGLTIWLEFEEFDNDLTKANYHFASAYGTDVIPVVHATAIYGMQHLTQEQASERLHKIAKLLPNGQWPVMDRPVAVKQDIAQEGRPGQVCSIAWSELTLKTSEEHEKVLDDIYDLFEVQRKDRPWCPHISLAYDNPEDSILNLPDLVSYIMQQPSLLQQQRRIKSLSLWNTEGKLGDWKCLDRVQLF